MARHQRMNANLRGRIYVCSRAMSAKYRLLANEEESIYGHSIPLVKLHIKLTNWIFRPSLLYSSYNYKAKPAERLGRKATDPRFLREAKDDSP